MTKIEPVVSIGIPTYNRVASCKRTIESVLAQEYSNLEIIISDNASTDGTESLCREFSSKDNRIRYIRQQTNLGATKNFDTVLKEATGEYFMWLGDDDWIDANYIRSCMATLEKDTDLSLVAGQMKNYRTDGAADVDGALVNINHDRPSARTLHFYRTMRENELFYGLYRLNLLTSLNTCNNFIGADSLILAQIAFLGKVRTIKETNVHRTRGGASASLEKMAQSLGVHPFQGKHFGMSVAWFALRDIVFDSTIYHSLPTTSRWILGLQVFHTIFQRHEVLPRIVRVLQVITPRGFYHKLRTYYRKRRDL